MTEWLEELKRYLPIKKQFILYGNIYDYFYLPGEGYLRLEELLWKYLKKYGYRFLAFYDLAGGVTFPEPGMREKFMTMLRGREREVLGNTAGGQRYIGPPSGGTSIPEVRTRSDVAGPDDLLYPDLLEAAAAFRRVVREASELCAVAVKYTDKIYTSQTHQDLTERRAFLHLHQASLEARSFPNQHGGITYHNLSFLIAARLGDVPAWFYQENPCVKHIQLSRPNREERKFFLERLEGRNFYQGDLLTDSEISQIAGEFADLTDNLTNSDLNNLKMLSHSEKVPLAKAKELVTIYKYGKVEDPWTKLDKEKVARAEEKLKERVIGQDEAVKAVVSMLMRAKTGLAGVQHSSRAAKPRGVLFFVGPTGVGKTELAKALTELIFGDESNFTRFDMSEYALEHAAEKFTGAPPGFVGFEEGGQLTNRVKTKPFSVILFDEIEKAHNKIMDKFLQILEDGRLTDGKGETVYFSETVLIFTSNIGSTREVVDANGRVRSEPAVDQQMTYEEIKQHYLRAVRDHFYLKLSRPELFTRLGENIIVFDCLREENVMLILRKALRGIENWGAERQFKIEFSPALLQYLKEQSFGDLMSGGWGINNKVENLVINKLARFIFECEPEQGSRIYVDYSEIKGVTCLLSQGSLSVS